MHFIGIIPARYASTRFPGKPLATILGQPMIERVYRQALLALDDVVVATDDTRIFDCVKAFGGHVVMTSDQHRTGTDRCYEALTCLNQQYDVVINIQGDEPFIDPEQIRQLKSCFDRESTDIATLIRPYPQDTSWEELNNPNTPKVIVNQHGEALYFSRSVIPYLRQQPHADWAKKHTYYKHIGIYAYKTDVLRRITQMQQTSLEQAESLEQLRWIENGLHIQTAVTMSETYAIDTPEDLLKVIQLFDQK